MKKLATSFVLILGLSFIGLQSFASEIENTTKAKATVSENPWEVFKEVVYTYKTSNVDFMYTSKAEQEAFLNAATEMKGRISEYTGFHVDQKIKKIDQAVTVFKYLWEIKEDIQLGSEEMELIEIPGVI
jgi:uncharacterized protein YfcZ (UPF0381/DUF406 family)